MPSDGFTALPEHAICIPALSPSLGATTELPAHRPGRGEALSPSWIIPGRYLSLLFPSSDLGSC